MQTLHTFLMFTGRAEEAINFYVSLFPAAEINSIVRKVHKDTGHETVLHASFTLHGQRFMAIDSEAIHNFDFSPSMSIFVNCETEEEVDELFKKLSEGGSIMMPLDTYPFSKKFAWFSDRFGVSWQISLV